MKLSFEVSSFQSPNCFFTGNARNNRIERSGSGVRLHDTRTVKGDRERVPDAVPGQQLVALVELPGGVHGERPELAEQVVPAGAEQESALLQPAERQDHADWSAADTENEHRP